MAKELQQKDGNRQSQAQRMAKLAQMGESIISTKDLANLWQIADKNVLHTTLKRYAKAQLLFRIYKGLYALSPVSKLNPIELGQKIINGYAYLTTESVLYNSGYISQRPQAITFVSSKNTKVTGSKDNYKYRQLQDKYLFNAQGIEKREKYLIATSERAIADMLYFQPTFHFDRQPDWGKIKKLQKDLGYPLTPERYKIITNY